jgi:hypothetical protein
MSENMIGWDNEAEVMTPDDQVTMFRPMGEVYETVTFSRYDAEHWVIAAYPRVQMREGGEFVGTTLEFPIPRGTDPSVFMAARIATFEGVGWKIADPAAIHLIPRVAEPWEIVDPTDRPCPF